MTQFLLDTNTLFDVVNQTIGWEKIVRKLDLYGHHRCAIRAITWHELRFGRLFGEGRQSQEKLARMDAAYGIYEILAFDAGAAAEAVAMRLALAKSGKGISFQDMLIAGHAIAAGRVMITANVREFGRVRDSQFKTGDVNAKA